ncbi:Trace amine-associated receptor 13c [Labeo rohita]|uniref:Trace amine-associated receptor 13c n=1 Tax=Labeo rohita TaxID=84645 RepID=A0ABQ8LNM6_LABRO|nr:Trace amine-associated receptor 13c [Labeo rohita]
MNLTAVNQSDVCQEHACPERSKHATAIRALQVHNSTQSSKNRVSDKSERKAAIQLGILVIVFLLCLLPYYICSLVSSYDNADRFYVRQVAVIIFYLNSTFNSIIYALFYPWFQKSLNCMFFSLDAAGLGKSQHVKCIKGTTSVSVHTVALIAVDRFLALSSPFVYSEKISPTVICIATIFNWLFSLFYNFTLLFVNGNFTDVTCPGICIAIIDGVSSFIDLIIVFLMPCTLIIILYTHVFVIAKKHATAIRALQVHNSTQSSKNRVSDKSERKAAILLGILVVVFLLCLLPYYICSLVIPYSDDDLFHIRDVTVMVFFLNSTINPIIYALFYPWFQKSLKLIFTFKVFNKDSSLMNVL